MSRYPRRPIEVTAVAVRPADCAQDVNSGSCCCTCRWHAIDYSHPYTDGGRVIHRRGWVCLAPEFDGVLSGWPEHGICEMWDLEDVA